MPSLGSSRDAGKCRRASRPPIDDSVKTIHESFERPPIGNYVVIRLENATILANPAAAKP